MKKGHQAGDYVAIDNFRLTGDGNFELGALSLATGIDEFRSSSIDSSSTFDSSSLIQTMGTKEQDVLTVTTDYEKMEGTGERDRISGSKGDNIINGGDGGDILKGGAGHDELLGGNGRDILEGGSGDDLLYGGQDQDILTGGAGMDIFVIALGDGPFDQINDFTARKDLVGLSNNLTFGQLTIEQAGIQDVMISANGEYLAKFINTRVGDFTEESFVST